MSILNKSPERNTWQKEKYVERQAEKGKTIDNDDDTRAMLEYYDSYDRERTERELDPKWQKNNLEYDLRSNKWICDKAKASEAYAQNLYAAMCNNSFLKLDVVPILKNDQWSCSWRYAGGIIADMIEQGDYIDWYCSGIRGGMDLDEENYTEEQKARLEILDKFVSESTVTEEIEQDLKQLGWIVIKDDN
jgi:hypothetical protein